MRAATGGGRTGVARWGAAAAVLVTVGLLAGCTGSAGPGPSSSSPRPSPTGSPRPSPSSSTAPALVPKSGDSWKLVQDAVDAAEAAGGGTVTLGPGTFTLSRTLLIGSGVRLLGSGYDTILTADHREDAYATVLNKGYDKKGYGGARDIEIGNLQVLSPKSNGIVLAHASGVYIHDV